MLFITKDESGKIKRIIFDDIKTFQAYQEQKEQTKTK